MHEKARASTSLQVSSFILVLLGAAVIKAAAEVNVLTMCK